MYAGRVARVLLYYYFLAPSTQMVKTSNGESIAPERSVNISMAPRSANFGPIYDDTWKDDVSLTSTIDVRSFDIKGKPKMSRITRSVKFAEEDEILLVRHIDDFSEEEIAEIWFDQQYYATIKSEYKEIIFAIEHGRHAESDEVTSRGLEHRTQEGSWARFQTKRDSYNAVLDEQDRQWKEDADDDERIGDIYRGHSQPCTRKAYQLGLMDEIAARQVYADSLQLQVKQLNQQLKNQAQDPKAPKRASSLRRSVSPVR